MAHDDFNQRENIFSTKVRAGKRRTYFFDVRKTKGDDYYITVTESTRKFDDNGYERHKIFLYKEDFNRFLNSLNETINHVKEDLMPDFDYDMYVRRQAEWDAKAAEEEAAEASGETNTATETPAAELTTSEAPKPDSEAPSVDDDLSW